MTDATPNPDPTGEALPEDPLARAKARVANVDPSRSVVEEFLAERRADAAL